MGRTVQTIVAWGVWGCFALVVSTWVGVLHGAEAAEAAEHALAQEILDATGIQGGLIVHLGCGDGRLTAALCRGDRYLVHGLDQDAANVEEARKHIRSLGRYGRVSVDRLSGTRLPYVDNLVNLVVSEDLGGVPVDEVRRVLCPDGAAYLKKDGKWTITVKPRPKEIDEWTHFLHDAGNNAVARDSVVGPPRRMQWVAGPLWLRSHETESGISALVSAGGRLFYIFDEGPVGIVDERLPSTWSLVARDALNGVQLWKRPIRSWGWREWKRGQLEGKDWTTLHGRRGSFPVQLARRLVAHGDRVFVTLGYVAPLTILDARSGETIRTCEGTEGTDEILYSQGIVVVCVRDIAADKARRRGQTVPDFLVGVQADTGKILWRTAANRALPMSLAVEAGRVFYHNGKEIVSLDLKTGQQLRRIPSVAGRGDTFVVHDRVALVSAAQRLSAFSAEDGEPLWSEKVPREQGAPRADLFVIDGLVWRGIGGVGRDLHTGEVKREVSIKNLRSVGHHHRCYRGKATERYIISAKEGVELLDIQSTNNSRNNWVRGACKYGIMPCNGLLYVPPDQCFCEPGVKLRGFAALAPEKEERSLTPGRAGPKQLETGPAFGELNLPPSAFPLPPSEDWPTYRHDRQRSGATPAAVPSSTELKPLWQVKLAGKITPPVVAGGRVFVAAVDAHTVHALLAEDGKPLWSFTAGGRVDSPPTIHRGRVLFGSADGWVYCLRASDGKLAWRFHAAPEDRLIGAFGRLESAWPVHGSVLVQNDVVYVAAGRSSFLDGGIFLYGLDPATGETLHRARLDGPHPDLSEGPGQCFYLDGARSEILVGDGSSVYMRQVQFDNRLAKQETPYITKLGDQRVGLHLFSTSSFLDGEWYNRAYWMYSARWPGYYLANQAPKSGQLIVFDEATTYAVKVFHRRNRHSTMFFPAQEGYLLFADDNANEPQLVGYDGKPKPVEWLPQNEYISSRGIAKLGDRAVDYDKGVGFTRTRPPKWAAWVPIRIQAMVLADKTLFVAGPPDVLDPDDPLAAFEGRLGQVLWAVSAADGKRLAEYRLDAPPALDGLIAAGGRLYLSGNDGTVLCLMGK